MIILLSDEERVAANTAINIALSYLGDTPQMSGAKSASKKLKRNNSDFTRDEIICMVLASGSVSSVMKETKKSDRDMMEKADFLDALSNKLKTYL